MSLTDFCCVRCGARCWYVGGDAASRVRIAHRMCRECDDDDAQAVRAEFARRVCAGRVARTDEMTAAGRLPAALGVVLASLVTLALVAAFVAPVAVEALLIGAVVAGVGWFAQLAGKFF